ncbi:hypothetical protein JYK14_25845 [Siccirubricoccus sp. KC 17139]|uniref:Lipoprotein n=1 Tax=Siccirubricoccus soli TaxID=2899147 RepID=A0ABT1DCA0_9PROT|nr:hypothetical protein [Siccirubricoccus soli]MCO6419561.1 hypothetical protein [Siccirubricoccus soli]MCP2685696.1 hypothetical protein [Siccirubricoccus soli]
MGTAPLRMALLAGLVLALPGCGTPRGAGPGPDYATLAPHEWDHGPAWAPGATAWAPSPYAYAWAGPGYFAPDPWYWGPSYRFGVRRDFWWRRHGWAGPHHHHFHRHRR